MSVGQISGYWAFPNPVYESLVPTTSEHPSRLSNRDLIKEIATAARAAGLKFEVALPAEHGVRAYQQPHLAQRLGRQAVQQRRQERPVRRGEPHPRATQLAL